MRGVAGAMFAWLEEEDAAASNEVGAPAKTQQPKMKKKSTKN